MSVDHQPRSQLLLLNMSCLVHWKLNGLPAEPALQIDLGMSQAQKTMLAVMQ